MLQPMWLIDVDGVLNAVWYPDRIPEGDLSDWRRLADGWFSPTVASFISAAAALCDLRWHTTWMHRADDELRVPLSLPQFPVLCERDWTHEEHGHWWKFDRVREHVPPDVPLVWTDDDLGAAWRMDEGGIRAYFRHRTGEQLLISPNPYRGLQQSHLDAIDEFITEHAV